MRDERLGVDFTSKLVTFHHRRTVDRSAGVHLSTVIHYILEKMFPKKYEGRGPIDPALAHQGFLWEDVLTWGFGLQFGELQMEVLLDDIFMTLDGFNHDAWRVREFKSTKMSARNPLTSMKFWHWHLQTAGYCHYMDTREVEMYILWINGGYELGGGRFGNTFMDSRLWTFSKREIRENWETVLRARDHMLRDKEWMRRLAA